MVHCRNFKVSKVVWCSYFGMFSSWRLFWLLFEKLGNFFRIIWSTSEATGGWIWGRKLSFSQTEVSNKKTLWNKCCFEILTWVLDEVSISMILTYQCTLLYEIPRWNNRLLSIRFIQWYHLIKSEEYLCKHTTGKTESVVDWGGGRERKRAAD